MIEQTTRIQFDPVRSSIVTLPGIVLLLLASLSVSNRVEAATATPPSEVSGVHLRRVGQDIQLDWEPVDTDMAGQPKTTTSYRVYIGTSPAFTADRAGSNMIGSPTQTEFVHHDAIPHGSLFYLVSAVDEAGVQGNVRPAKVTTPKVWSVAFTGAEIELKWTRPFPENLVDEFLLLWGSQPRYYAHGTSVGSMLSWTVPTPSENDAFFSVLARDTEGNYSAVGQNTPVHLISGSDGSPPAIEAHAHPTPNEYGWNQTDVTVSFACSPLATCPATSIVNSEGAGQLITGTAADDLGNAATVGLIVNLDKTPPMEALSATPSPNPAGWNNTPVDVVFSCVDFLSGIANCPSPVTVSEDGTSQTINGTATDRAGNSSEVSTSLNIDQTPPDLQVEAPGAATVHMPEFTVTGSAEDLLSGISTLTCGQVIASLSDTAFSCPLLLNEGLNSIPITVTDIASNEVTSDLGLFFARLPHVTITIPTTPSYVNISPTTVGGTVDDPRALVTVNSIPATVVNGAFSVAIPLGEGPNVVTATATAPEGAVGADSVQVTLDTTPPRVTIGTPPSGFVTTADSINVAGIVNDLVVGTVNEDQAHVRVNGTAAEVANRTFLARGIPLDFGENVIQALATDVVGNAGATEIAVTRVPSSTRPRIELVSGDGQSGAIGSVLPTPLIVALTDAAGSPFSGQPVVFKVTRNDGLLAADGPSAPSLIVRTDENGRAEASWTLGARAGAGSDAVEAYSVGFDGTSIFTASGTQGAPGKIVIDSGNDQVGVIGEPLSKPLIAVVVDEGNNRLANFPVTFTVTEGGGSIDGLVSRTITTDSDGRTAVTLTLGQFEGEANNLVEVTYLSNNGSPARFIASSRASGDPAATTISGVVLDNSNVPIPGVTVRAVLTTALRASINAVRMATAVQTDLQGQFVLPEAPVGPVKLMVDGTTSQLPGHYPSLEYDMVTVAGRNNTVRMPIYLLPLNPANQLCVTEDSGGGTLTIPEAPGFSLSFAPGQVTFPGGSKSGCISVTVVHGDKVPMVPGFGQQPRFIVTIQPAGAIFNPPAPITLPNVDGLPPRAVTEMYSFDHDIGSFVAVGTGSVTDDGLVIRSSPGVGVLKAGWHCGGDPNSTAPVAPLEVTLSVSESDVPAGSTVIATAHGSPPLDASYIQWEVVDDPADPDDDPSVAHFVSSPSCDNQPICPAQLKGDKLGTASVRVTLKCNTTGATTTSNIVKVTFRLGLRVKEVSFGGDILILKDQLGGAPPVFDPVWKDTNSASQNSPVAYVGGSTVSATVKFEVDPVPAAPVSGITIEGEIPGLGRLSKSGVTIPPSAELTVAGIAAAEALPATTKYLHPMTIHWRHMTDGISCPKCVDDGDTEHTMYVTLATPIAPAYLTSLHLAVSGAEASTPYDALNSTWAFFGTGSAPADVRTWENRSLVYYPAGVNFDGCASDVRDLLTRAKGGGRCGAFAHLMQSALAMNGIASSTVVVRGTEDAFMLVKTFSFTSAPSFPSAPEYKWLFVPSSSSPAINEMVPIPPLSLYGDLTSDPGVPGQNSTTPSEKAHSNHGIIKSALSPLYYDPSYGLTYNDAADFETQALHGYCKPFLGDPARTSRCRSSVGLHRVEFR